MRLGRSAASSGDTCVECYTAIRSFSDSFSSVLRFSGVLKLYLKERREMHSFTDAVYTVGAVSAAGALREKGKLLFYADERIRVRGRRTIFWSSSRKLYAHEMKAVQWKKERTLWDWEPERGERLPRGICPENNRERTLYALLRVRFTKMSKPVYFFIYPQALLHRRFYRGSPLYFLPYTSWKFPVFRALARSFIEKQICSADKLHSSFPLSISRSLFLFLSLLCGILCIPRLDLDEIAIIEKKKKFNSLRHRNFSINCEHILYCCILQISIHQSSIRHIIEI